MNFYVGEWALLDGLDKGFVTSINHYTHSNLTFYKVYLPKFASEYMASESRLQKLDNERFDYIPELVDLALDTKDEQWFRFLARSGDDERNGNPRTDY